MEPDLASPGVLRRLASLLYELLLLAALLLAYQALLTALLPWKTQPGLARLVNQLLLPTVLFGYFGLSWVRGGQTVAMKAWRLKLVRADGMSLGWRDALLRFAVCL